MLSGGRPHFTSIDAEDKYVAVMLGSVCVLRTVQLLHEQTDSNEHDRLHTVCPSL